MSRPAYASLLKFLLLLTAACASVKDVPSLPSVHPDTPAPPAPDVAVFGEERGDERIRVLILSDLDTVSIEGVNTKLFLHYTGRGMVEVNGRKRKLPLRFISSKGSLSVNKRPYRGAIEVFESKEGMLVVNELSLESYLVGLINREISSRWPPEAVKAQAVIARTYALYQKEKRKGELFHLSGTFMDQVYTGMGVEDDAALRAVRDTEGEVLGYNGGLALSLYHSNAGGVTEDSSEVWQEGYPYLRSVESPYDMEAPVFSWNLVLDASTLGERLRKAGYSIGEPVMISPVERSATGRVKALLIEDVHGLSIVLRGEDLRRAVGYTALKSTMFDVRSIGDVFVFEGRGSGHGVGLSQWGAKGMAERGFSYREILEHFYPGTTLVKVY